MESIIKPVKRLSRQMTDHFRQNVYEFKEGSLEEVELLGIKGANLCEMFHLGLPVPPGFVITTAAYHEYIENGWDLTEYVEETYRIALESIENSSLKKFGGSSPRMPNPLLLSVRASSTVKMPG